MPMKNLPSYTRFFFFSILLLSIGESEEETGLTLDPASAKFVVANNNIMTEIDRHYVTIFMAADVMGSSEPRVNSMQRLSLFSYGNIVFSTVANSLILPLVVL